MHVLLKNEWGGGFLDYHLGEKEVRIQVDGWVALDRIEDQYISYSLGDWRLILNYLVEIGPVSVVQKIISRWSEQNRNRKWLGVGWGVITESTSEHHGQPGEHVAFVAYNHPKCVDCITIDERMVVALEAPFPRTAGSLRFFDQNCHSVKAGKLSEYAGWSPYSGRPVDRTLIGAELERVLQSLGSDDKQSTRLPVAPQVAASERKAEDNPDKATVARAVLFGLGNYAKTAIMPNLPDAIEVATIHEIDPLQIGRSERWQCGLDTAGELRDSERYDVFLIAGYHHTHTPLVMQAVAQGAAAVVEKPICTTREQLEQLQVAIDEDARIFACFHKRYSQLNDWAREDLQLHSGRPVSYHCIVYEIPLPQRHWYNWPSSGSRIISNGCHWLDHFMYLNNYAVVRDYDARRAANGEIAVRVELENDAFFTMTLTDIGSSRLGVRDYVELHANGRTARLIDNSRYESEDGGRIMRRDEINRMDGFKRMYSTIGDQILAGHRGDSSQTLRSSELMLDVDDCLGA